MSDRFGSKAVFRSALLITGSTYVAYAAGLLTNTVIARSLGPADFGRYSYLIWLSGLLVVFMNNGLTTSAIRFVSECVGRGEADAARKLHRWFSARQWAAVLGVAAVFLAVLPWLKPAGWDGNLMVFAALALTAAVARAWYLFGVSVAKGHGLFGLEAGSVSLLAVASMVAAVGAMFAGAGLMGFLVIFVLHSLAHPVVIAIWSRKAGVASAAGASDPALLQRVRPHLYWTVVLTFAAALSNKSFETYLLNSMVGAEAVGFFTIAAALTRGGVDLLSSGLTSILMPTMAHAYGAGGVDRVSRITSDAARYFQYLGLLLAGVGAFWAAPVISIMYGPAYHQAAFLLQVMVVVGGLTLTQGTFGALLSTTDNQRVRAGVSVFSVAFSAVAALLLVPRFGILGAVAAHAVSSLVVLAVVAGFVVVTLKIRLPFADLGRMFLAAGCALAVAAPVALAWHGPLGQGLAGVVYGLAYLASSLLLRVWYARDLEVIGSAARRFSFLAGVPAWLDRWTRPA
ncbi:lipopolysaccharide biosynthesis protein [Eleftheria terrae]|uniref:lipopolysaccharide biosynthesis protein n=1 Tax=Eleftheria terrae TaxID=1597781 RepID=UPI00263B4B1B|nr:polysaccharide biosynthesis C-terminal domain-containing protein [Eleftheria terrae]WKB53899.1 oligosaccharide flippase family protein [Eleftheria terrae]